jgi:hypothetical protein
MRVGIVCEGATDFITTSSFLTHSMLRRGLHIDFIDLQPGLDKTSEMNSGWSNALLWLERNPLKSRKNNILGSGLFSGSLSWKKCDVILIQLDCDCREDEGFHIFLKKRSVNLKNLQQHDKICEDLTEALLRLSELNQEQCADERHIICCVTHNSESWCIAALSDTADRPVEQIDLSETSEIYLNSVSNYPISEAIPVSRRVKDRNLRTQFCNDNKSLSERVEARSETYRTLVDQACALAQK